jgi:hypothetical protein
MKDMGYKRPSYAMPESTSTKSPTKEYTSVFCSSGPLAEEFKDASLGDVVTMTVKFKVTSLSINKMKEWDKVSVNLDILEADKAKDE